MKDQKLKAKNEASIDSQKTIDKFGNNAFDNFTKKVKLQLQKVESKIPEKYKEDLNRYEKVISKEFQNIKDKLKKDSKGNRPILHYILAFVFFYYIFIR
jgi:hypothetical protein